MIKEVVPLAEPLVAVHVVALEDLDVALRSRVFVGEDAVVLSIGPVLVDADLTQVKLLSSLDID